MIRIDTYIIEKLKISSSDIKKNMDSELQNSYDFLVKLFDEEHVSYTIDIYKSQADNNQYIKVVITDKDLLDKKKADRYVGNINTILYANKIKVRGMFPTINKKGNKKVSMTILFYQKI